MPGDPEGGHGNHHASDVSAGAGRKGFGLIWTNITLVRLPHYDHKVDPGRPGRPSHGVTAERANTSER